MIVGYVWAMSITAIDDVKFGTYSVEIKNDKVVKIILMITKYEKRYIQ